MADVAKNESPMKGDVDEEKGLITEKPKEAAPAAPGKAEVSTILLISLLGLVIGTQTVKEVYRSITLQELIHNASIFSMITCLVSMIIEFCCVAWFEGAEGIRDLWKGIPWWNMDNLKAFGPCAPLFSLQKIPDTLAPVFINPGLAGIFKQVNPMITNALTPVIVGRTSSAKEWVAIVGIVATVIGFQYVNSGGKAAAGGSGIMLGAILIVLGRTLGAIGGLISEKSMKKQAKKSVYIQKFWMDCCELAVGPIFFLLMPFLLAPIDMMGISDTKLAEKEDYTIMSANFLTIKTPDSAIAKLNKQIAGISGDDKLLARVKTVCANGSAADCMEEVTSYAARRDGKNIKVFSELQATIADIVAKTTKFPIGRVNGKIKDGNFKNFTLGAQRVKDGNVDVRATYKQVNANFWCVENLGEKKKVMGDLNKKIKEAGNGQAGSFLAGPAGQSVDQMKLQLADWKLNLFKFAEKFGLKQTVEQRCGDKLIGKVGQNWILAQKSKPARPDAQGHVHAAPADPLASFQLAPLVTKSVIAGAPFTTAMNTITGDARFTAANTSDRKKVPEHVKFTDESLTEASLRFGDFNTGAPIDGSADTFLCAQDRCDPVQLKRQYAYMKSTVEKHEKDGSLQTSVLADYGSGPFRNMFCFAMILNAVINAGSNLVGAVVTKRLSAVWKALGQTLATMFTFWTYDFYFHSAEGGAFSMGSQQILALAAMSVLMLVNTIFFASAKPAGKH